MQTTILNIALLLVTIIPTSSIYTIHITTIDGQDKAMSEFHGKKILIIVVPVTRTVDDSSFFRTIDSISRKYSDRLSVIGVPAFENGYDPADLTSLSTYYHALMGEQITLTLGMYTKKQSGSVQHELFSWLTHSEKNDHFDDEVGGPGQKFFVSENGELYGVSGPDGRITTRLIDRMIQRQHN